MSTGKRAQFELRIARQALLEWNRSRSPIDRVLQLTLREHQVGANQRGPIGNAVYTMVRGWPYLVPTDFKPENPVHSREFDEILADAFEMTPRRLMQLHERAKPQWEKNPIEHLSRVHGMPSFLVSDARGKAELWHDYLQASQFAEAPLTLRTNTLKTTPELLIERLRGELPAEITVEPSPFVPNCLRVSHRFPLHLGAAFGEGLFEVQDEHSQLISLLAAPRSGERVLDLCAGAGGKTLHLAALLGNRSEIHAYDLIKNKRVELRSRAKRAGADNIRVLDDLKIRDKFDLVLVDAPCSSLGTLRRNPDRMLHFRPEEARQLVSIQSDLLLRAFDFLNPGGRVVYATCTMRNSENAGLIDSVVSQRSQRIRPLRDRLKDALHPGSAGDFLAALDRSPTQRLLEGAAASTCLQLGPSPAVQGSDPSQTSGALIGDGFFAALIE